LCYTTPDIQTKQEKKIRWRNPTKFHLTHGKVFGCNEDFLDTTTSKTEKGAKGNK